MSTRSHFCVCKGEELIRLAEEKNLVLSSFQNRRFDSDFRTITEKVLPRVGRVMYYSSQWKRFRPQVKDGWRWKADEPASGLLWDLGAHMFDQAVVVFKEMPSAVTCVTSRQRDGVEADDYFLCHLEFPSHPGSVCVLESGCMFRTDFTGERCFSVHGTSASYEKLRGIDNQESMLRSGKTPSEPGFGVEPSSHYGVMDGAPVQSCVGDYVREYYEPIGRAILNRTERPPVSGRDGLNVVKIILAAEESARTGQKVHLH